MFFLLFFSSLSTHFICCCWVEFSLSSFWPFFNFSTFSSYSNTFFFLVFWWYPSGRSGQFEQISKQTKFFHEISRWSGIAAHVCVCVCVCVYNCTYGFKIKCCAGAASLNGGSSSFDGGLDGLVGPCYSPCYSADIEGLESGDDGLLVDNSSTCSSSTQAAPCSSAAGKLDPWSLALYPSKTLANKQKTKRKTRTSRSLWASWKNRQMTTKPVGVWHQFQFLIFFFLALILYLELVVSR